MSKMNEMVDRVMDSDDPEKELEFYEDELTRGEAAVLHTWYQLKVLQQKVTKLFNAKEARQER